MGDFNWICPHCEKHVTIIEDKYSTNDHYLYIDNVYGIIIARSLFIVCPNPQCKKYTFGISLHTTRHDGRSRVADKTIKEWRLVPEYSYISFPKYIPKAILDDYEESCKIKSLSPKASATLSRRCLQGIIRDYWKVSKPRLVDEIEEIKDKIDPLTWKAIDSVRKIGNIGAHMEKDINLIIDVDPSEADLLINLIETLLRDWYIDREERRLRMEAIVTAASNKSTP